MTTGSKIIGGNYTPLYYYRVWDGGDSIRPPNSTYMYTNEFVYVPGQGYKRKVLRPRKLKLGWNAYTCTARIGGSTGHNITIAQSYGIFGDPWNSNDELKLQAKLADAARGHSFNLGIALGEGNKTIALAVNTVTRCFKAIRALKKGRFDLALRNLGASPKRVYHDSPFPLGPNGRKLRAGERLALTDVSSMWLEVQYGWKPLFMDLYESGQAYAAIANKARSLTFKVTHGKQHEVHQVNTYNNRDAVGFRLGIITAKLTEDLSVARTLGLADPRAVVWEIVPFSFVADWFIPFGTYLDNLAVIPHLSGRFLLTSLIRQNGSCTGTKSPQLGSSSHCSVTQVTRTISTGLSVPRPRFKPLSKAMSGVHLASAVALLHQIVTIEDTHFKTGRLKGLRK